MAPSPQLLQLTLHLLKRLVHRLFGWIRGPQQALLHLYACDSIKWALDFVCSG